MVGGTARVARNTLAAHIDIFPTLADLSGAPVPADIHFVGRSLAPLLKDPLAPWQDRFLFTHVGRWDTGKAKEAEYARCRVRSAQYSLANSKQETTGNSTTWRWIRARARTSLHCTVKPWHAWTPLNLAGGMKFCRSSRMKTRSFHRLLRTRNCASSSSGAAQESFRGAPGPCNTGIETHAERLSPYRREWAQHSQVSIASTLRRMVSAASVTCNTSHSEPRMCAWPHAAMRWTVSLVNLLTSSIGIAASE